MCCGFVWVTEKCTGARGLTAAVAAVGILALPGLSGCAQPGPAPQAEAAADRGAEAPAKPADGSPGTAEPAPAEPELPARPAAPPRRLTVAMVGDMMLGTDYPENRLPDDDGAGFLSAVTPILDSADLALGNLEGVLAGDAEPVKACSNLAACYLFRSPPYYAEHFRVAGFDGLSLANNHALDFGEEGRSSTMRPSRAPSAPRPTQASCPPAQARSSWSRASSTSGMVRRPSAMSK